MPYCGHNVYGLRASDYAVRTGIIDEPGFSDVWCEWCWWEEFGEQADLTPDHRGRPTWGGAHGALGFYWWPTRMSGGSCRVCGIDFSTDEAVERENAHRESMCERFPEACHV